MKKSEVTPAATPKHPIFVSNERFIDWTRTD